MSIEFGLLEQPAVRRRELTVNGRPFGRIHYEPDGERRAQISFGEPFAITAFGTGATELEAIQAATLEADRLIQLSIDRLAELRAALQQDESKAA